MNFFICFSPDIEWIKTFFFPRRDCPYKSTLIPFSHLGHFSIYFVQGVSKLHESLLRLCEIPVIHDDNIIKVIK